MEKKVSGWKTKGMNRDISVSAFNSEFAFENRNLRLSTNDSNTTMSWVNEKGTKNLSLSICTTPWLDSESLSNEYEYCIEGIPIGTAILNHSLILFTIQSNPGFLNNDRIYKLWANNDPVVEGIDHPDFKGKLIYKGHLNFSTEFPLETIASYESNAVQKVYWTDGRNQPRIINVEAPIDKLRRWNHNGIQFNGVDTFFDFVPTINFESTLTVTKRVAGGMFFPGVIQYCYTYINKYGQQTNIIDVSPLYYLAHEDRGASPEEKVINSFEINITNPDLNFDYIRIYSIQRTSIDSTPIVKLLEDLDITGIVYNISYIDNGTTGSTMDPTELLFIGGKEITALTMAEKDNTLFLGNLKQKNTLVDDIQSACINNVIDGESGISDIVEFVTEETIIENNQEQTVPIKHLDLESPNGFYFYENQLKYNSREITTFKGGEIYRFGFQLQKPTGEWLEPVWIGDKVNELYPKSKLYSTGIDLTCAIADISLSTLGIDISLYKRIRPVIVYPSIVDRNILCQGVLNPTVFNIEDRENKNTFSQASWYFRPFMMPDNITISKSAPLPDAPAVNESSSATAPTIVLPDQGFSPSDYREYYIALIEFHSSEDAEEILKRGYIYTVETLFQGENEAEQGEPLNPGLDKIVKGPLYMIHEIKAIPINVASNRYLIISNSQFYPDVVYKEINTTPVPDTDPYEYQTWVRSLNLGSKVIPGSNGKTQDGMVSSILTSRDAQFKIWGNMPSTWNNQLYYNMPSDNPEVEYADPYIFDCYVYDSNDSSTPYHCYRISFDSQYNELWNWVIQDNNSGQGLVFNHYESLPCQMDPTETSPGSGIVDPNHKYTVEIQGSKKKYLSPYKGDDTNNIAGSEETNSQFFVDQSIVTLNSPDLEFDPEVQVYGNEGLNLRIVGAIPITANISSHAITTSSNMLAVGLKNDIASSTDDDLSKYGKFGAGELNTNVTHYNVDRFGGKRLVAEFLWNDIAIVKLKYDKDKNKDAVTTSHNTANYMIYPWQRTGSLNNDSRNASEASSVLETKKEANLLYSYQTEYLPPVVPDQIRDDKQMLEFENISTQVHLTENSQILTKRLAKQKKGFSDINYYPNIDKVLYYTGGAPCVSDERFVKEILVNRQGTVINDHYKYLDFIATVSPTHMKYISTTHAVIALNSANKNNEESVVPVLPGAEWIDESDPNAPVTYNVGECIYSSQCEANHYNTVWGDSYAVFNMGRINISDLFKNNETPIPHNFLWIGELYKEPSKPFGGTSKEALEGNRWLIAGDAVKLPSSNNASVRLKWTDGDTYFQRYDCLKTYAFTKEDPNQLVEILSFMCETHVNIDGRYDRNRGQARNYNMSPEIFNLYNTIYSQKNNFFTGIKQDLKDTDLHYPNQITFSKTKTTGADVDLYTNVTLGSVLEMDGDKGKVTSLQRLNDQLIAFQDSGIAQILYNENVQISTTAGVPIEIANSGKVQGKRYISDTIGCSNKWSIANTPSGIYFMDSNDKSIYLFNGQLNNLSLSGGFNTWCKSNIPDSTVDWNPLDFDNFVSYYDRQNQDILFISDTDCLAYSEKLNAFTSFYSYENAPYFCNLDDVGIWINKNNKIENSPYCLWKHNAGNYCEFFKVQKPYSMTLIGNPFPQTDKVFANLEFRACVDSDGTEGNTERKPFNFHLPFDSLEAWNEYQHGISNLKQLSSHAAFKHHTNNNDATLKRKFRIWRCDIPRDNVVIPPQPILPDNPTEEETAAYNAAVEERQAFLDNEAKNGISRFRSHPLDRIRNPWVYLKLLKEASESPMSRTEIHDILMYYYM